MIAIYINIRESFFSAIDFLIRNLPFDISSYISYPWLSLDSFWRDVLAILIMVSGSMSGVVYKELGHDKIYTIPIWEKFYNKQSNFHHSFMLALSNLLVEAKSNMGVLPIGVDPPVNFAESDDAPEDAELMMTVQWADVEFEVAFVSGAQDHVCDLVDCPGSS